MFNGFVESRKKQRSASSLESNNSLQEKYRKLKMLRLAENSERRTGNWVDKIWNEPEFNANYHQGAIPLKHEQNHNFKDLLQRSQIKKKDFFPYNYIDEKSRAFQTWKSIKDRIQKQNLYQYIDKTKNWLRKRQSQKEIQEPMRFNGAKTEKERLQWGFRRSPPTDTQVIPTKHKFYMDPKWKEVNPNKWLSHKDFKAGKSTPWGITTNSSEYLYEPHIDGFEVTGDVQIKREKNKEICSKPFKSTIQPWKSIKINENGFLATKSIRSYKSYQGLVASINPEMLRSKSTRAGTSNRVLNFDDSAPFEIKISNPVSDVSSVKSIPKSSRSKALRSNFNLKNTEPIIKGPVKMYYKTIQSKMVNPKTKNTKEHKRRGSMSNLPTYNIYDLISTKTPFN